MSLRAVILIVPELVLFKIKLSIADVPELISNETFPTPARVPILWLVMLPLETVTEPLFKLKVPSMLAPSLSVSEELTKVVPLPVIVLSNEPPALKEPELLIFPNSLSTSLVSVPLLLTLPVI